MRLLISRLNTPLREMLLVTDPDQRIHALGFTDHRSQLHRGLRERFGHYEWTEAAAPDAIADDLARYFAGELDALDNLATDISGTLLQQSVWSALRRIPAGTTISYGQLARKLGLTDPRAAFAIGAANGANPVAMVIPCHRVIASDGELKGYAWGVQRKRWLLEHEKALLPQVQAPSTAQLPGF